MNKQKKRKSKTILAQSGRSREYAKGAVNIPPYRSSTVLFDTLKEYKDWDHEYSTYRYGRLGSPNSLALEEAYSCLLYTSPSPRDQRGSRMPSSA